VRALGIPAVVLFGVPARKDAVGSEADDPQGVVPSAVRAIRESVPDLCVITDVCLCEYTDHGHCGVLREEEVDNDPTLEVLAREAVCHARAGAHVVAPSDMMDGRVGAIRRALDAAGFQDLPILSYAAKYASGFYGPFREAAESTPQFGDRRGYQMDPGNGDEALREIALDLDEGADMVMVKPALPYLDVIRRARERFPSTSSISAPAPLRMNTGSSSPTARIARTGELTPPGISLCARRQSGVVAVRATRRTPSPST